MELSKKGDRMGIMMTGYISNESYSSSRGQKFVDSAGGMSVFTLGQNEMLFPGVEEGIYEMCVGEKREIHVPPSIAYGDEGHEGSEPYDDWPGSLSVPKNATLTYHIECGLVAKMEPPNLFAEMDENGDGGITEAEFQTWFKAVENKDAPAEMMVDQDSNGDGFVDWHEFTAGESP